MMKKHIQLKKINRAVFDLIYHRGYALREQITLAIRGRRVANDRYLHRVLRKMEQLNILSARRQSALGEKIYSLTRRNSAGRRLAIALFGEDRRAVSGRPDARIDHALFLTWVYVCAHLASRQRGYPYAYLDAFDLAERSWGLMPDGVIVIEKAEGRRAFCVEYQRLQSVERTTLRKLAAYQAEAETIRADLRAGRLWVLFIMAVEARWLERFARSLTHSGPFLFAAEESFLGTEPGALWTAPIWYPPGVTSPVPIFLPRT